MSADAPPSDESDGKPSKQRTTLQATRGVRGEEEEGNWKINAGNGGGGNDDDRASRKKEKRVQKSATLPSLILMDDPIQLDVV